MKSIEDALVPSLPKFSVKTTVTATVTANPKDQAFLQYAVELNRLECPIPDECTLIQEPLQTHPPKSNPRLAIAYMWQKCSRAFTF